MEIVKQKFEKFINFVMTEINKSQKFVANIKEEDVKKELAREEDLIPESGYTEDIYFYGKLKSLLIGTGVSVSIGRVADGDRVYIFKDDVDITDMLEYIGDAINNIPSNED